MQILKPKAETFLGIENKVYADTVSNYKQKIGFI